MMASSFALALGDLAEQIVQRNFLIGGELFLLGLDSALIRQLTGQFFVFDRVENITCRRHSVRPVISTGGGRTCLFQIAALVITHHADTTHSGSGDHDIALMQCALLNQNGGHRAAGPCPGAFRSPRLWHGGWVGLQLFDFRYQNEFSSRSSMP